MLPIHALLNPAPPSPSQSSPSSIARHLVSDRSLHLSNGPTSCEGVSPEFGRATTFVPRGLDRNKPNGPINYRPFEDVDEHSAQEIAKFSIGTFRNIANVCEHIPYNSAKKDFFEKTGRESIEVFRYEFCVPGGHTTYTVMWDYNVGLVRMTPFFKCLGYSKTKPSQMLDRNPGLRDISPSVTGGSVSAQGYWMPFRCARAICATFCYPIAGALIPIFGQSFPHDCIKPNSPRFRDMRIDPKIIEYATLEAVQSRRHELGRLNRLQSNCKSPPRQRLPSIATLNTSLPPNVPNNRVSSMQRGSWKPINTRTCPGDAPSGASLPGPVSIAAPGRRPLVEERPNMNLRDLGPPLGFLHHPNSHNPSPQANERQNGYGSTLAKRRRTGFQVPHLSRNPRGDENSIYQMEQSRREDMSVASVLMGLQTNRKDIHR